MIWLTCKCHMKENTTIVLKMANGFEEKWKMSFVIFISYLQEQIVRYFDGENMVFFWCVWESVLWTVQVFLFYLPGIGSLKGWLGSELNIDSFKTHCHFSLKLLHIIFLKGQIKHGGNSYHLKASHVLDTMLHIL